MENNEEVLYLGDKATQLILRMNEDQQISIHADTLDQYYKINHNPLKGETAKGEFERWLDFIKTTRHIRCAFVVEDNAYYFKRFKQ